MREPFDSRCYYHVYNRGVDKRPIFLDEGDFRRFYESMYLFNDANYRHLSSRPEHKELLLSSHEMFFVDRDPDVRIVAFCLLNNHFHLLLLQIRADGISKFLHRLSMGYVRYFNLKYHRTGSLFEGAFKAKPVDFEEHLEILPRYIHLNALDGSSLAWRGGEILSYELVRTLLDNYKWSSHHAYTDKGQALPVVDDEEIRKRFRNTGDYWNYLLRPSLGDGPITSIYETVDF